MKKRIAWLLLVVMLLVPMTGALAVGPCSADQIAYTEARMVQEINKIRAEAGVPLLTRVAALDRYARDWSGEQAYQGSFFHRDWGSMQNAIPGVTAMNENVLMWRVDYMGDLEDFVREGIGWWKNSPVHYGNMTNSAYNVVGLGIVERRGTFFATLNVGYAPGVTPEEPQMPAEPEKPEDAVRSEVPFDPNKPAYTLGEVLALVGDAIPGLNYALSIDDNPETRRAVIGKGYIVEGSNDELNGAVEVSVTKTDKGKTEVSLVDREGKPVKSKGYVQIYMVVPEDTPRPFRMKVDGKMTQFEFVEASNMVEFTTVFK